MPKCSYVCFLPKADIHDEAANVCSAEDSNNRTILSML